MIVPRKAIQVYTFEMKHIVAKTAQWMHLVNYTKYIHSHSLTL